VRSSSNSSNSVEGISYFAIISLVPIGFISQIFWSFKMFLYSLNENTFFSCEGCS